MSEKEFSTSYPMRRNADAPHLGRKLADKAAEHGSCGYDDPIQPLVQTNYSFNTPAMHARSAAMRKKLGGKLESDLNQGYNSKNKLGGTPVRKIEKRTDSYNE